MPVKTRASSRKGAKIVNEQVSNFNCVFLVIVAC